MIHARKDYMHIQDSTGKIHKDEPVFLLRAQDKLAVDTMLFWARKLEESGGSKEVVLTVRRHAQAMCDWQSTNSCKIPDVDLDQLV